MNRVVVGGGIPPRKYKQSRRRSKMNGEKKKIQKGEGCSRKTFSIEPPTFEGALPFANPFHGGDLEEPQHGPRSEGRTIQYGGEPVVGARKWEMYYS